MGRRYGPRATKTRAIAVCVIVIGALVVLGGCARSSGPASAETPVTVSREALGTVVTVTAWGTDEAALRSGADDAFAEMREVESELDPYSATSTISALNTDPYQWHTLPRSAVQILDRVDSLGAADTFSPRMFGVTKMYGFGGDETVPDPKALLEAAKYSSYFERQGDRARFEQAYGSFPGDTPHAGPGLDFGGAAKGLALDRAMARLRRTPGIEAALISTVSSTVAWGTKPDGEPWRIGVEDPRATGSVLVIVSGKGTGTLNVSTSGDYQQYFERNGVRYHHILDPKTGQPARGVRSLTAFGRLSGMDADILSTALFVAGRSRALAYAKKAGVGVYLVDEDGKSGSYVPPDLAGVALEVLREPKP